MYFQESMIFLMDEDVQTMLEIDSSTIASLSSAKVLLSLKLSDGKLAFPEFQFKEGTYHPELIVSFQKFNESFSGWDVATWFYKWNENLRDIPVKYVNSVEGVLKLRMVIDLEMSLARL